MSLHKVKVFAAVISPNDQYLVSLGGEDDGTIIVWDLKKGTAIYRAPASKASTGLAHTLSFANSSDLTFITAGSMNIRVWRINLNDQKAYSTDCQTGQLKRNIKCIVVDEADKYFYCGTSSGDVLQFDLNSHLFKSLGPAKSKVSF